MWILLFFRKEQAPSFLSTPSSPLYPVENDNITLQWTYTLDGSPLDEVEVLFTPDSLSLSVLRVARYRSGGTTQVASEIQDRFVFNLTDSQSTMTILRSQRSDSGTYELRVSPDVLNQAAICNVVKISMKCKYNDFPCFFLRDFYNNTDNNNDNNNNNNNDNNKYGSDDFHLETYYFMNY